MKTTTKFKIAKNPVDINVRVLMPSRWEKNDKGEDVWALSYYMSVPTDGWKVEQNLLPGHDFYVTSAKDSKDGFYLTEYSTGTNVSGAYPDKTKNKAAEWLRTRLDAMPSFKIVQLIQQTLIAQGRYNGFEKEFQSDRGEVKYSALAEINACPGEIFDLDTIPVGSTYYLETGDTLKRIL
jgi:hypothetical protein